MPPVNFKGPISSSSARAIAPHLFSKKGSSRIRRSRFPLSPLNPQTTFQTTFMATASSFDDLGLGDSPKSNISDPPLPDDTRCIQLAQADDLRKRMGKDSAGDVVLRRGYVRSDSSGSCTCLLL
jgi:hypothetical protein